MNLKYFCFPIIFISYMGVCQDIISANDIIRIKYISETYFTSGSPTRTLLDLIYRLQTSAPAACDFDIYEEKSIERICREYNRYSERIAIDSVKIEDFIGVRGIVLILLKDSSTRYLSIPGSWSQNISVNGKVYDNNNRILRVLRKCLSGYCKKELSILIRRNKKRK